MSAGEDIGLAAALVTLGGAGIGVFRWWHGHRHGTPDIPAEPLHSPFKLLVVDDRKFEHVERLKRDGFDITFRNDIDRFRDIEDFQFDLILMDLHGVGLALSDEGGRGLIEHIKKRSPSQIVVAYTAHQGTPSAFEGVFKDADQVLDKAAGYLVFKTCIEQQLERLRSPEHYIESIMPELNAAARWRLQPLVEAAIETGARSSDSAEKISSLPEGSRLAAERAVLHARTVGRRLRSVD